MARMPSISGRYASAGFAPITSVPPGRRDIVRAAEGSVKPCQAGEALVPVERIELPTFGLQNRCSTAELNRLKAIDRIDAGSIAADRIRMSQPPASVYGRRLGRVNRRIRLRPLPGRGLATRSAIEIERPT